MGSRQAVSPVDTAWLRMDTETNPMVITAMLGLGGPLDAAALEQLVARVVAFPRFRQRIAPPAHGVGLPHWEDDPYFDAALHVHRVALPSPGGAAALAELVSDVMSTPLDRSRPLWDLHVVEGVEPPEGHGTALVARIHHCLGDGLALVRLLLSLVGLDSHPVEVGRPPAAPVAHLGDLLSRTAREAAALTRLVGIPFDSAAPFSLAQSRRKRVAWSGAIPLERIKRIARGAGAKTNDVLMAAVTAAVRSYLLGHSGLREGAVIHAIVPVLLRGTSEDPTLGNHFGLVFAALPVAIDSPLGRVQEMKRTMDSIKASEDANVTFAILGAAGLAGEEVERLVVDIFSRKGSLLVTNVAGPPVPLGIGGQAVESMTVWAPTSGHVGFGVSLLSYGDSIRMSVASDVALVPDPERFVAAFEEDLARLEELGAPGGATGASRAKETA